MHFASRVLAVAEGDRSQRIFWLTPDRFDVKPDKSSWLEMARGLRDLGWRAEVVASCADADTADHYDGVVTYVRSLDKPMLFRLSTMLATLIYLWRQSKRGDIFIFNEDSLWLLPFFRLMGQRHLHLDIRTFPVTVLGLKQRLNRWLFWTVPVRLFARFANTYSFITRMLQEMFVDEFGFDLAPSCIWESGVNLSMFGRAEAVDPSTAYTVFYHGSLYLSRGIGEVIEAMVPFTGRQDVRLVIVGLGVEIDYLKARVNELGVAELVTFRGFVPYEQITGEIAGADVCICPLPDRPEWQMSSPLKVLEYMACSKPMILTRIRAHEDMVRDAPFVVWADGSDAADFSAAIESAMQGRVHLARSAESGPEFIRDRYEWSAHAATLDLHLRTAKR